MFSKPIMVILSILFSISIANQALALGEAVTELADKVGDSMGIGVKEKEIDNNADNALKQLFTTTPAAEKLSKTAKAILIYPKIYKAGMGIGGQHGEGALRKQGQTVAYYNTVAASYGLQLGAQSFGFTMFFMNDKSLEYLEKSEGWEVGVGPNVVIVDEGIAKTLTTTTATEDVYVFTFNQKGLMAGMGIQGSKITQIHPEK